MITSTYELEEFRIYWVGEVALNKYEVLLGITVLSMYVFGVPCSQSAQRAASTAQSRDGRVNSSKKKFF